MRSLEWLVFPSLPVPERAHLCDVEREIKVARVNKKRARELQHDAFRDKTLSAFDKLGDRLAGKGRSILYVIGGLVLLAALAGGYSWWRNRKTEEASAALGRAIDIATTPVSSAAPLPGATTPSFTSEQERAERAVNEFQKVEAKYGDPFRAQAHYFRATNLLTLDRGRGISELEAVSKSDVESIARWGKFALAQAKEAEGQYDAAAALYTELAKNTDTGGIPIETLNLRLASVYEKQGKKAEAADLLFRLVETARKATDKDNKPALQSAAAGDAAQKLLRLDPSRHAQLPPEPGRE